MIQVRSLDPGLELELELLFNCVIGYKVNRWLKNDREYIPTICFIIYPCVTVRN
jgi:hypothetical protein